MNRTTLGLESLELRENPAITVFAVQGILSITSDAAGDIVQVKPDGAGVRVQQWANNQWNDFGPVHLGITKIVFTGNAGNDMFSNATSIKLEADGGAGDDTLSGGT